jgi:hypothetical protein
MNHHEDPSTRKIREALASLHLPRMPEAGQPTIRILVVADLDLASASALAEYTLLQKNEIFDASMVDLCIACGSFVRDEDLAPYVRGKQVRRSDNATASSYTQAYVRSREETASLEGLMTAALSQLESIVCRVVYCPGAQDPITTLLLDRRLTPNSRNLHQQWLQLAPGIGCAAFLYVDAVETILQQASGKNHAEDGFQEDGFDNYEEEADDTPKSTWSELLLQIQQRYVI